MSLGRQSAEDDLRRQVYVNLSANTEPLPNFKRLNDAASAGDLQAARPLSDIARDSLHYLTGGMKTAKIEYHPVVGLFGGDYEASLGVSMTFHESERP